MARRAYTPTAVEGTVLSVARKNVYKQKPENVLKRMVINRVHATIWLFIGKKLWAIQFSNTRIRRMWMWKAVRLSERARLCHKIGASISWYYKYSNYPARSLFAFNRYCIDLYWRHFSAVFDYRALFSPFWAFLASSVWFTVQTNKCTMCALFTLSTDIFGRSLFSGKSNAYRSDVIGHVSTNHMPVSAYNQWAYSQSIVYEPILKTRKNTQTSM